LILVHEQQQQTAIFHSLYGSFALSYEQKEVSSPQDF
jgi:hypothetical protein